MARSDWQTISGTTNNNSYFFTGIRWRYRDDLFGTSGYPASRIASNTDIIEYQPYVGRKVSSATSKYYNAWLTSYYKYSYNSTSGTDPGTASNQLNVSTTYRFDQASNNTNYYLTKGSGLSSNTVMNTNSSTTSRIIQVPHCSDGTSKLKLYFYFAGNNSTGFHYAETNDIVTLETIPRYTTITSFSVSKRNETSLTFNWQTADTVDYIWYSTDWGTTWKGVDVTDGTSGNFVVDSLSANTNNLTPNTTYNCLIRVRRKDSQLTTDSSKVSQTTNAVPTISLSSKTETTITMNWSCDANVSRIQYSLDNGSTWSGGISVTVGTSGSYTITGLSANTTYNIKFSMERQVVQTWYATATNTQTTYQYPYVSAVSSSNLTIGNSQTLTLYNPLGRTVTVNMKKDNSTGTSFYSGTTSGTSITFTPNANTMYSTISSSLYGDAFYYCSYSVSGSGMVVGYVRGKYIVNETINKPTLSSNSLTDTNNTTIALTGSSSKIVLNASTLQISVTATGKNYASISTIKIEGSSRTVTSGGSGASLTGTATYTITNPSKSSFSVEITDSRGLVTSTTVSIASGNIVNYIPLTIVGAGSRNQPTDGKVNISSSGKYFNGSFGSVSNSLTTQYRWKESGGDFGSWTNLPNTTSTGTHSEPQVQLSDKDYTKSFVFEFRAVDQLSSVTSTVLITKGQPIFNWDNDEFNINGTLKINEIPIIESGNNTNGSYIKYADGTMICWHVIVGSQFNCTSRYTGISDSFFYQDTNSASENTKAWTFPQAFYSTDKLETNVTVQSAAYSMTAVGNLSASSCTYYCCLPYPVQNVTFKWHVRAIGRWKA